MSRLLVIAVFLWIVGSPATGAAIQIGRLRAAPASLSTLHLTDCALPCWIGIEIGHTSRIEAREPILAVFAGVYSFRVLRDMYTEVLNLVNISLQAPGDPVQIVDFTLATGIGPAVKHIVIRTSTLITVAELHNLLGPPTYVLTAQGLPSLDYSDSERGLRVTVTKGSPLAPAEPIVQIDPFSEPQGGTGYILWQGFARLSRYERP